jgi:tetratricopeptide (TPR) repeat protein/predicted Ser/Thr protein kinase
VDLINRDLGRYRVLERLGRGGMGEAFRARDARLERDVAIKVLAPDMLADEDARRRLRHEALSLSRLNHPSIATVHDFDTVDGIDFVVMELIDGVPLSARIARAAVPEAEAIGYAREIAGALQAAHAAGIIHRDLKPGNVVITRANRVKVIDFGLARVFQAKDELDVTRSIIDDPGMVGTVPYMPPEQLQAAAVDARSDVYALGVVLYEMLTGLRPFRDRVMPRLMDAILHHAPVPVRSLNPAVSLALDDLVLKCLAKDARHRFQTARELADSLDRLAAGGGADAASAVRAVPAVAHAVSVVALPARVVGSDADEFLGDAIPNTLTTELARHAGLDMKWPPTAQDVARVGGDLTRIAAAYQASACIVTTVTTTARKLSMNVQLVEPGTRRVMWARELEGTRKAYLSLLREAAAGIRERLNVAPGAVDSVTGRSVASSIELVLQRAGYYSNLFVNRGRPADLERAVAGFNDVLAGQPQSAAALEGLAVLELSRVVVGAQLAEIAPNVESYARRALAIDPRSARAWSALGEIQPFTTPEQYRLKLEYALRGAALGPSDDFTQARLSAPLTVGSATLAREAAREAARLDPLAFTGHIYEAMFNSVLGDHLHGLRCIDQALALEPDAPFSLYVKTLILIVADREEEAIAHAEALKPLGEAGRLHPQWVQFAVALAGARAAMAAGGARADEFCTYMKKAGSGALPFPRWQGTTSGVAILLSRYGRPDAAVDLLVARRDAGMREPLDLLLLHEDLRHLTSDPRYASLVRDAREQFVTMVEIMGAARTRGELPTYLDRVLSDLLSRQPIAAALGA